MLCPQNMSLGPRLPESSVWHVLKRCTGLMWGVWGSTFDDEFMELCSQKMKAAAPTTFIWHRYLQDSKEGLGSKYRSFTTACTSGPIPAAPSIDLVMGTSHLGEEQKEEFLRVSELL